MSGVCAIFGKTTAYNGSALHSTIAHLLDIQDAQDQHPNPYRPSPPRAARQTIQGPPSPWCLARVPPAQSGTGSWIVIASNGRSGYWTKAFAHADDKQKPDGVAVFTYEQAANKARALARGDANAAADRPATIAEALDAYEADLTGRGRSAYNATHARIHLPDHLLAQPLSTSHQQAASSLARRSDPNRHGAGDRQPRHEGSPSRVRARGASETPVSSPMRRRGA